MKISAQRADAFARKPDSKMLAVLVYGPDLGLVRERATSLVQFGLGGKDDPFRLSELIGTSLKDDPARLRDEASAMPFGGGRRVVRVRDGRDDCAEACTRLLDKGDMDALVVVEAGDLPKRSALRRLFEGAGNAAAVPCYADDGEALDGVIRTSLEADKIRVSPAARAMLLERLGADRMLSRAELTKLASYVGPGATVEETDVEAVVGDANEASIDDVCFAAFGGDQAALDTALARAYADGLMPVVMVRAAMRHVERLMIVVSQIDNGGSAEQAVGSLRPPVFFKRLAAFSSQARRWKRDALSRAFARLMEAELRCKTTGLPAESICNRALMEIAQAAGRVARRN
ncbi:MAG: DNA polymerase III subunit delta [Rhizobiaceae bacterium]